jgi:RNA polymerase sigma factor (sigma-70 family)
LTELQLIQALQQGTESAFKQLVDNYRDRVYHTILGFVQQPEDAEDLAQDVFIKVYENIRQFKGESALGTWVYRIAVTQSLDFLRRKNRKKRGGTILGFFGFGEREDLHPKEFDHPGVKAENKEKAAVLFKAINTLPENQRSAFLLQKLEGLSQNEIAEVLRTTSPAVESLLSRARANLKKQLTDYYHEKH